MISIRPAQEDDLPEIHAIYNHYVLNTVLTFLRHGPPLSYTAEKFHDLKSRNLPFLVAVEEEESISQSNDTMKRGKVCGFASASPFRGYMLSYAPTVELTLFLLPTHKSRGIGGKLLESLTIALRETAHVSCEFAGDAEYEAHSESGGVRVRNLLAVMAVDVDGRDEGEWLRSWYVGKGFEEVGRMKKVGFKMGRW